MHQSAVDIGVAYFPKEHTDCPWVWMCTPEELPNHWRCLSLQKSRHSEIQLMIAYHKPVIIKTTFYEHANCDLQT